MGRTANAMSKRKKAAFGVAAVSMAVVVALALCELLLAGKAYLDHGTFSIPVMLEEEETNAFVRDITAGQGPYIKTLFPHPYLGFVHQKDKGPEINNVGLLGHDFPAERNPAKFTILLTGGSVAAQFAQLRRHGVKYLEAILNERYDFRGREVVVLNGGAGAWKQPQQTILFLLYADAVDAVVTLDGFNEHYSMFDPKRRLECPASNFHKANPFVYGYERLFVSYLADKLYTGSRTSWLVNHSYTAYFVTRSVRQLLHDRARRLQEHATTVESIFALPDDWGEAKRRQFNIDLYRKYIEVMHVVAQSRGIKDAYFLQPAPAIGKKLTAEEAAAAGDLAYRDIYIEIARQLMTERAKGIPIHSLLDVFDGVDGPIYADAIHCRSDGDERNESLGYRLMAERIADTLETDWGLVRK